MVVVKATQQVSDTPNRCCFSSRSFKKTKSHFLGRKEKKRFTSSSASVGLRGAPPKPLTTGVLHPNKDQGGGRRSEEPEGHLCVTPPRPSGGTGRLLVPRSHPPPAVWSSAARTNQSKTCCFSNADTDERSGRPCQSGAQRSLFIYRASRLSLSLSLASCCDETTKLWSPKPQTAAPPPAHHVTRQERRDARCEQCAHMTSARTREKLKARPLIGRRAGRTGK